MPRSSAALLLILATACVYCLAVVEAVTAVSGGATSYVLFGVTPHHKIITTSTAMIHHCHSRRLVGLTSTLRGGASVDADDEDDEDEMEESEYDECADEEEEGGSMITHAASTPGSKSSDAATKNNKVTLATSTQELIQKKQTTEMKSQFKKAVSASSSTSSKKKSSGNSLYKRYVPYIIRATLNPITLWTMTKAYFVSLCDINYGKEVSRTEKYRSTICLFLCLFLVVMERRSVKKNKTRSMYIYATKLLDHYTTLWSKHTFCCVRWI